LRHVRAPFRRALLQPGQRQIEPVEMIADIKPQIGDDLIVPGARRVQASGGRADQFGQARFHMRMDVFQGAGELELAALDL
jgi:hypothetical protein